MAHFIVSPTSPIPQFPNSPIPHLPTSPSPHFPTSPIPQFPNSPLPSPHHPCSGAPAENFFGKLQIGLSRYKLDISMVLINSYQSN
ncbi:MAG: hypothetical protein IM500_14995 [Microcystis sp. M179S2]|nr:hypothetical protein [Microcystis sp. M179S2]